MEKLIKVHTVDEREWLLNPANIVAVVPKVGKQQLTKVFVSGLNHWATVTESGEDVAAMIEAASGK